MRVNIIVEVANLTNFTAKFGALTNCIRLFRKATDFIILFKNLKKLL